MVRNQQQIIKSLKLSNIVVNIFFLIRLCIIHNKLFLKSE